MKIDGTIIRDLNRIINDRNVISQHRNVASRAIKLLTEMIEPEGTETRIDPNMIACVCARTPTDECSQCDGSGFITRKKYAAILRAREERFLEIHDIQL